MSSLKRICSIIFTAIFLIMIPITLLFMDVQLVAFNRNYYSSQFDKYEITENVKMEKEELMSATEKLLLYMDGKRENLDFTALIDGEQTEFFSSRDKQHMVDVKSLFDAGKKIRNIGLIIIAAFLIYIIRYKKDWKYRLSKYGIYTFFIGIFPIVMLIILMNIDFNKYFTVFHEIFFTNDLWLLDPAKDMLINIFPESFFADSAFRIGYYYLAELVMILAGSVLFKKKLANASMHRGGGK